MTLTLTERPFYLQLLHPNFLSQLGQQARFFNLFQRRDTNSEVTELSQLWLQTCGMISHYMSGRILHNFTCCFKSLLKAHVYFLAFEMCECEILSYFLSAHLLFNFYSSFFGSVSFTPGLYLSITFAVIVQHFDQPCLLFLKSALSIKCYDEIIPSWVRFFTNSQMEGLSSSFSIRELKPLCRMKGYHRSCTVTCLLV